MLKSQFTHSFSYVHNKILQGKAKWDAWNSKKGMSQDEAKQEIISIIDFISITVVGSN